MAQFPNNRIEYGNGDISIDIGDSVKGFDILLSGTYELESYDNSNFLISYNNGRLIGVGLGSTLGVAPFLKYTGNLRILRCIVITDSMEKIYLTPSSRLDRFGVIADDFDGVNTKFENLDNIGIVGKIPKKIKINIITKNQHTKGGDYILNGKDYKGYYHLHHTGVAMSGAEHTEDSETLELKDKRKRTRTTLRTTRTIRSTSTGGTY